MTPAERVVIEAAIRLRKEPYASSGGARVDLALAVDALLAERAGKTPDELREMELTWGQVVEGDEIWSDRTKKFYLVVDAVRSMDAYPTMKIRLEGSRRFLNPMPAADPVKVRRGETGQALDAFATVLWSGERG